MAATNELLGPILRDVSRSFYLTLRVLPRSVRPQIGLAYLLARATDSIADTNLVPWKDRVERLRQFRERIRSTDALPVDFSDLAQQQDNPAEHRLLDHSHEMLEMLDTLMPEDRGQVQLLLETITRGQELDLRRFGDGSKLASLKTPTELDDYTYHVAGCVGELRRGVGVQGDRHSEGTGGAEQQTEAKPVKARRHARCRHGEPELVALTWWSTAWYEETRRPK